mgnify:CR=1 FL=1
MRPPEKQMSSNIIEERSLILRLEFSIADAVRHRGLRSVLVAALKAWWDQRPPNYADVPSYLREDVGLPPENEPLIWYSSPPLAAVPSLRHRRRH